MGPPPSFKGAYLVSQHLQVNNADQISGAKMRRLDSIAVKLNKSILIRGKTHELFLPAQFQPDIVLVDELFGVRAADLKEVHISIVNQSSVMFDLSGLHLPVCGGDLPTQTDYCYRRKAANLDLRLNAPGVIFRNIKTNPNNGRVKLRGNFDGARFESSILDDVFLVSGSLRNLDLSASEIKRITLHMDDIDADGIQFPEIENRVSFVWQSNMRRNWITTNGRYAKHLASAWNSWHLCDALAKYLLNTSGAKQDPVVMCSRAMTVSGVRRYERQLPSFIAVGFMRFYLERETLYGVIARRNQLKFAPTFTSPVVGSKHSSSLP